MNLFGYVQMAIDPRQAQYFYVKKTSQAPEDQNVKKDEYNMDVIESRLLEQIDLISADQTNMYLLLYSKESRNLYYVIRSIYMDLGSKANQMLDDEEIKDMIKKVKDEKLGDRHEFREYDPEFESREEFQKR